MSRWITEYNRQIKKQHFLDSLSAYNEYESGAHYNPDFDKNILIHLGNELHIAAMAAGMIWNQYTGQYEPELPLTAPGPQVGPYNPEKEQSRPPGWWGDTTAACEHQWVDVGFQHSKFVCKKCNENKK